MEKDYYSEYKNIKDFLAKEKYISTTYYKDLDKNLLVNFNTFKYPDTQDLDSMTAGFKIKYCPMCGRKL